MDFFAIAVPGMEALVAEELSELGVESARVVDGGVEFSGELADAYRVNLHSRLASRVLMRIASFHAPHFSALQAQSRKVEWLRWLPAGAPVRARAATHRSRLHHAGQLARAVERVVANEIGARNDADAAPERNQTVFVRLDHNRCQVSLDMSGALLHQRGYRTEAGAAPLRETLAAAILRLARWDASTEALLDPFCGAGTLPIEAALQAMAIPPGRRRRFAFQEWSDFDEEVWKRLLEQADEAQQNAKPLSIRGTDADPEAITIARRNAARAGVEEHVTFETVPLAESWPAQDSKGLIVANPPYGRRLSGPAQARRLYGDLGNVLAERYHGWRAALLCPNRRAAAALNLLITGYHPLSNGGSRVDLALATV